MITEIATSKQTQDRRKRPQQSDPDSSTQPWSCVVLAGTGRLKSGRALWLTRVHLQLGLPSNVAHDAPTKNILNAMRASGRKMR